MRKAFSGLLYGLAAAVWLTGSAAGYDLPALNLGFTSFVDGGPPAGPGWYYTQYVQYYTADQLNDDGGNKLLVPGAAGNLVAPELDAWISLSQLIYQSDKAVLGDGKWGMDFILPYASFDVSPGGTPITENSGVGDLLVGPFLQWDPVMGENGPKFVQRVELQLLLPTGDYDSDRAINPGHNAFSFNPYYAITVFPAPRWTGTARVHYLWNDKNDDAHDPNPADELVVRDTQAGQAVHANFAAAYEAIPQKLRLGLNGYYLRQITETDINGDSAEDTKEQVLGIGPGGVWHLSRDAHLFVNYYRETEVENRPEGDRLNVRFVYHF